MLLTPAAGIALVHAGIRGGDRRPPAGRGPGRPQAWHGATAVVALAVVRRRRGALLAAARIPVRREVRLGDHRRQGPRGVRLPRHAARRQDTLIGNANTDGTAWMYAVAGLHPLWTHYDYPVQQGPGYHRFIFWAYADDADTDPRVAEAVKALNIRYVVTSTPVVRGFVMPDGLVSLDKSRSWEKIYDNGEARIYEWRGAAVEEMLGTDDKQHRRRQHRDHRQADADGLPTQDADGKSLTDLVEQPAKVMRIGTMIKQLLEEVQGGTARRRQPQPAARDPPDQHPRARGRAGAGAARGAGAADAAVHRGRGAVGRRAADRPGPAGRLAGRAVPRHPDRAVRPADGRPSAAGADAPGRAAARRRRARDSAADRRLPAPGSTCKPGNPCDRPSHRTSRPATRGWSSRSSTPRRGR